MSAKFKENRTLLGQPIRRVMRAYAYFKYGLKMWLVAAILETLFSGAWQGYIEFPDSQWRSALWMLVEQLISFAPITLAIVVTNRWPPQPHLSYWLVKLTAIFIAALLGPILHDVLLYKADLPWWRSHWFQLLNNWLALLFPAALLTANYELHGKSTQAADRAFRIRADRIVLETELNKARLQLLRAQIEPHFLFNTLANVRQLHRLEPDAGQVLLDQLIHYLAAALPELRREHSSLREETALIRAYIEIYRIRMGSRLNYEIAFPDELLDVPLPPMMLMTLVENAIKHGLAPLPEGGFLKISALAQRGTLEVRVADSGRGMVVGSSGHGIGLANLRARLAGVYGGAASLSLSINQPRGLTAMLSLPLVPAE